jgi:hypothetical protein
MTDAANVENYTADEISMAKLNALVANKASFKIFMVEDISIMVKKIEGTIDKNRMRCRVYTEYRSAALAAAAIPIGITQITGFATALGIGVHNIATINQDYEIAKNSVNSTVTVVYKK